MAANRSPYERIALLTDLVKQNSIVLLSYSAAHDQVKYFLIGSILSDPLSLKMRVNWLALIFLENLGGVL